MFNLFHHFIAFAADAATEAATEATTLVETEFAGSTVPVTTNILFIVGLVLMGGVALVAITYLRNHVKNWAYPIYAGAIFYLLFSFIIIQGLSLLLRFIPSLTEYAAAHEGMAPVWLDMSLYGLRILTDSAAIYLGLRYFRKSALKRRIEPVIGHSMSFGVACYIACILAGGIFTNYFQGITYANAINSQGYQVMLTDLVSGGRRDQAFWEGYLNTFIHPDGWRMFFATFMNKTYMALPGIWPTSAMCPAYIAASVLVYENLNKKLDNKWLLAAFGIIVLMWAPFVPSIAFDIPAWASAIWYTLLMAVCVLALYYLFKHDLKEELTAFKYSRMEEQQKEYQKAHKMPTIVMPRDEDLQPVGSPGVNTEQDSEAEQEARKAAEEAFGMTEEEAQAIMAEEAEEAVEAADDLPDEDGGKERE